MTPRLHIDANVVLRFLRNDDPKQSPAAANLFASAKAGKWHLLISGVTIAEVFYVLARAYRLGNVEAAQRLTPFVQSDVVDVENRGRVLDTLRRVINANVDFGDAYLVATAFERADKVASFDHDMSSFKDVASIVPQ